MYLSCLLKIYKHEIDILIFIWADYEKKVYLTVIFINFLQYQQNEQSPLILTGITDHKKNTRYDVGNRGPGLGQPQKCDGVKPING